RAPGRQRNAADSKRCDDRVAPSDQRRPIEVVERYDRSVKHGDHSITTDRRSGMGSKLRQKEILDALHRDGRVEVPELAERLGISAITIRRDLDQLAESGALRSVRGGAVTNSLRGEGLPFEVRAADASPLK